MILSLIHYTMSLALSHTNHTECIIMYLPYPHSLLERVYEDGDVFEVHPAAELVEVEGDEGQRRVVVRHGVGEVRVGYHLEGKKKSIVFSLAVNSKSSWIKKFKSMHTSENLEPKRPKIMHVRFLVKFVPHAL